jgi:hypothetical protein
MPEKKALNAANKHGSSVVRRKSWQFVAHALVRAASRLISTPVPRAMETKGQTSKLSKTQEAAISPMRQLGVCAGVEVT